MSNINFTHIDASELLITGTTISGTNDGLVKQGFNVGFADDTQKVFYTGDNGVAVRINKEAQVAVTASISATLGSKLYNLLESLRTVGESGQMTNNELESRYLCFIHATKTSNDGFRRADYMRYFVVSRSSESPNKSSVEDVEDEHIAIYSIKGLMRFTERSVPVI